jgi:hypothetical protein
LRVALGQNDARLSQGRFLPREILWISGGPAHESYDHQVPPGFDRDLARLLNDRYDFTGGICMRSISKDHIQEDDRRLRIGGFFDEPFISQSVIDHRMGPSAREHIVTQIDDGVRATRPDIL